MKIGPESEDFWLKLPSLTNEMWLHRALESFSGAEKLEEWKYKSDRFTSIRPRLTVSSGIGVENCSLGSDSVTGSVDTILKIQ